MKAAKKVSNETPMGFISYLEKIIKSRLRLVRFSELLLKIPDGFIVRVYLEEP